MVGRTFRYGVASAYERAQGARLVERGGRDTPVYDLSQARVPMPQDEEDDPTLDQVRHVDCREDWGPPLQDLHLQEAASSSSSEWYGSDESRVDTTRPPTSDMEPHSPVSLRGPLEGDAEFAGSEPARNEADHEGSAGQVAYRALDAALLVLYGERELRVELPGWSFEEVHSIVRSIQEGDWSHFYEVMSWGPSRINWSVGPASSSNQAVAAREIAVGSEDEVPIVSQEEEAEAQASFFQDEEGDTGFSDVGEGTSTSWFEENPPPIIVAALEQLGWSNWMIGSGVLFVGLFVLLRLLVGTVWFGVSGSRSLEGIFDVVWNEETSYPPELYVSGVWVAAMLHRLGILLLGWRTNPNRIGVLYSGGVRVVGCEGRFWVFVWLWLIILLGFVEPSEAQKRESALLSRLGSSDEQAPMDTTPWREDWMLAP